ncbi:MAG: hypothetical protein Q4G21_07440 [Dermabacter sp.]|nr:hypothetical protein [Dermabacter sp.]
MTWLQAHRIRTLLACIIAALGMVLLLGHIPLAAPSAQGGGFKVFPLALLLPLVLSCGLSLALTRIPRELEAGSSRPIATYELATIMIAVALHTGALLAAHALGHPLALAAAVNGLVFCALTLAVPASSAAVMWLPVAFFLTMHMFGTTSTDPEEWALTAHQDPNLTTLFLAAGFFTLAMLTRAVLSTDAMRHVRRRV